MDPLEYLVCPLSRQPLRREGSFLVSASGQHRYPFSPTGIPLFTAGFCSEEGRRQQEHYDRVARTYLENLTYPHTEEYMRYLDGALMSVVGDGALGDIAEICCGRGEAIRLLTRRFSFGLGVDVSLEMLEAARRDLSGAHLLFVQGDATMLPLRSACCDHVFMLGGVHHVNDRRALFAEVFRILKPGGRFIYREPVSDFLLWRWLRAVVYRLSPALDHSTERPLLRADTVAVLERAGFRHRVWRTCGFLGAAFLLNSDVLFFNRLFRFVPGIRRVTRTMAVFDDWAVRRPGLGHAGLQVIGMAEKPAVADSRAEPVAGVRPARGTS
jgi:ubiquinone/menaquinone biosynthesis C-methylase UbiE